MLNSYPNTVKFDMRVLVTGVTGQVGSALISALAGKTTVLPSTRSEIDLSSSSEIAAKLDCLEPDLIINPAAYTAVDRAEDEPDLAYRINADAPGYIARWAASHAIPLLHLSTDYVFDGSGERPWQEEDA